MEALKTVNADLHILACPPDCALSFAPYADEAGFVLSTGPRENVLGRYCAAIRRFSVDRVIRATGDNPFVFADAAYMINSEAVKRKADYGSYSGLPYGAGVESVHAEALLRAEKKASCMEREHVCPYLYNHPELFSLYRPPAPREWQGGALRVTVDTFEDYRRAQKLYAALASYTEPHTRYSGASVIAAYTELFGPEPGAV
jgi:spore coat polysaccharide biosynthesis protein SpsF